MQYMSFSMNRIENILRNAGPAEWLHGKLRLHSYKRMGPDIKRLIWSTLYVRLVNIIHQSANSARDEL